MARKQTVGLVVMMGLILSFQNCSGVEFTAMATDDLTKGAGTSTMEIEKDVVADTEIVSNDELVKDGGLTLEENTEEVADYAALCAGSADESLVELADGADVIGERGNVHYKATNIGEISEAYGNLKFYGSGGKIESVTSRGNLVICALNVDAIINYARGNLVIVGGNVGSIDGMHGNLTIVGGTVLGEIKNVTGVIKVTE